MAETAIANPLIGAYLKVLDRNHKVILGNLEGVGHEDSLLPFTEGGSHLNWLIGHLTHTRCGILRVSGAEAPWGPERGERYGNGSAAPSAAEAEPFEELVAAFRATGPLVEEALAGLSEADLAREAGNSTVGGRLEFLVWHESYHSGQTTLYRRMAGHERTLP